MIDAHTHLGVIPSRSSPLDEPGLTAEQLVDRMKWVKGLETQPRKREAIESGNPLGILGADS